MHKRLATPLLAGVAAFVPRVPACATTSDIDLGTCVHVLLEQLHCLVCQNQTLASSNADPAVDLRHQIHEQLRVGATEADTKDYLTQCYGDPVLYRPPIKRLTYLLWFGPMLLLMAVVFGIVSSRRQQELTPSESDVNAQARLTALLIASSPEDSRR